jgi:amino acid adenylation domain-containing protein/thioester reductase-like protein
MPEFLGVFEEVVRARRHASAVVAHDATLSFVALEADARHLADRLRAARVREGDVVALALGRTSLHVVGMLAAWYAGAAFLPLDPEAPAQRVREMLDESRARVLLSHRRGRVVLEELPPDRAPLAAAADDLAYVIYTSGSSGRPKGVRVAHAGLGPVLRAQIGAFGLGPGKRSLLYLSTAFDASISDIGTSLLSGAVLVVAERPPAPMDLPATLRADAITHADLPPSILPLVDPAALPESFETVVIGGEVASAAAVRAWARRVRVINVYGPTEATICTSLCACDAQGWTRALLGDPLGHVEYEVDDGELLIAGPALALGYIDRPELEASRFVARGGKRWYRTGDLVRRHDDGALEFLGRRDRQIKVHGHLVCPEEIESRLRAIDGVADAVVVEPLVARVEPAPGAALSPAELRARLEAELPCWMVPRLEIVGALPRGPARKIDRAALSAADRRTRAIAEAFEAVLGIPNVGEDDDAAALGADSLAALEIAARAQLSGVSIEAPLVLAARTPAAIARASTPTARTASDLDALAERLLGEHGLVEANAGRDREAADGDDWLLTGATGFLGRRLLAELLSRTSAHGSRVHCLVRAANDAAARARLGELGHHRRVVAHAGDVSAPRLGLPFECWQDLTRRVVHVLHAAASLSLALSFDTLDATNVRGAVEVARFVSTGAAKRLHHVSSLAVLASTDLGEETLVTFEGSPRAPKRQARPAPLRFASLDERTVLYPETRVVGAYAQTKCVAEALFRRTVADLQVIRPGLLTADSVTSVGSATCPLASFLRAARALGCLPVARDDWLRVDVTPIDLASRAIADVVTAARHEPVVHVASHTGASLADLVRALREHAPLERVPRDEFLRRAQARLSRDTALAFVAASFRLLECDAQRGADLFLHTGRLFPCTPLERITGRRMPPIDDALLSRYVTHTLEARAAKRSEPRPGSSRGSPLERK